MREPIGRGSRDFPPREPPRGPKALIEPPAGPRGSHGDFRGDFGYRGDFGRGGRGRGGRGGRGGWRDDSRDRSREAERDLRGPREDRGLPPFRDDRSRDRDRWDRNDNFRGRRQSSPPVRGRSPIYGARDSRDLPSSLDVDRARRGSRDGPLSGGSPSSDSLQGFRGYGRGRGGRGRGRGAYHDDFQGRNPSPDPMWNRRTQPSATPPPQVPAFGSTSTNLPVPPIAPKNFTAASSVPPAGPVVESASGMPIPTAPRSQRPDIKVGRAHGPAHGPTKSSLQWINPDVSKKEVLKIQLRPQSPSRVYSPSLAFAPNPQSNRKGSSDDRKTPTDEVAIQDGKPAAAMFNDLVASQQLKKKRCPILGKRLLATTTRESPPVPEDDYDDSDADSVDSIGRGDFFEEDMKKIEDQISKLPQNPEDDPLDFAKISEESGEPLPDPEDTATMKIWEVELKYHKVLRQKRYNQQLLDLSPFRPKTELNPIFLQPFIKSQLDSSLIPIHSDDLSMAQESIISQKCTSAAQKETQSILSNVTLAPKPQNRGRSRPTTPSPSSGSDKQPKLNGQAVITPLETGTSKVLAASEMPEANSGFPITSSTTTSLDTLSRTPVLEPVTSAGPTANGRNNKTGLLLETFLDSDYEQTPEERLEELQSVRKMMKTPSVSSLPNFNVKKWEQDEEFMKTLNDPDPLVEDYVKKKRAHTITRRKQEQDEEGRKWAERYYNYRVWTDYSDDPACVRSREKFAKARENAATEIATAKSSTPAPNSKPEPSRRAGRWATEHDIERVLRESEQEANQAKEKEERSVRARTASAKEATIPAMCWDFEQWEETAYANQIGLVPLERSFAILEYGEPIDNFTPEENDAFEKTYMEFPKQWGKIADALPDRDYKACIQHYYLVKHETHLKEKGKKVGKKRGRAKGQTKGKPKSTVLMADLPADGEDGQENDVGGERRRPRRAAAPTFNTPADSDAASPGPTPSRKTAAAPKGENGSDAPPPKRKQKTPREKGSKQAKNSQLLAAAPTPAIRESPTQPQPQIGHNGSNSSNRLPPQLEGAATTPAKNFATLPYLHVGPNPTGVFTGLESMSQSFPSRERDSATPMSFDTQDRRNPLHTSSYWSVPEKTDFPELLRYFGTDWHAIARFMTSKTHIMVYTDNFKNWLRPSSDKTMSRRVANHQAQVKNYYQRHVDSGKMLIWKEIAEDADAKKAKGESTGPLPIPTAPVPKPQNHSSSGRLGSAIDGMEEMQSPNQSGMLQQAQASPTQQTMSSRFTALAQAGPVPQTHSQPATPTSLLTKQTPTMQNSPHASQQIQQQVRPPRGPSLGYFNTDPQRPILQATSSQPSTRPPMVGDAISQRSLMVAQEAQLERQQALRIQEQEARLAHAQAQQQIMEQLLQQQQQSIQRDMQRDMQRDRQHQMKQEVEPPSLNQFEPYSVAPSHGNGMSHTRPDGFGSVPRSDVRRTAPPQQYQPGSHQVAQSFLSDSTNIGREIKASPSPALPRGPMSAPPASQEQYSAPPSASALATAPPRQPEPVSRRSNIMSLLNDPEPIEPVRSAPTQRFSDVTSNVQQPSQTPPPQQNLQQSRYGSHPAQSISQQPQQAPQQLQAHVGQQHQHQQQAPHSYPQTSQQSMHQHSSSIGISRSYTPTGFDTRGYGHPPASMQQQSQQHIYSQPSRTSMTSQAPQIRREASHGELHSLASGYARPSQASSRLKESPYAASPGAPPSQASRQPNASPLDLAQAPERDYYSRQPQFLMQQQGNAASSPQAGPAYHPQAQQAAPNHRHLAFGQALSHIASPPPQFAGQHPLHGSRQNSLDAGSRYAIPGSSASAPSQPGYAQAPQHQGQHPGPPLGLQYQQQHPAHDTFESRRETDRRLEEAYHLKRLEESRRR